MEQPQENTIIMSVDVGEKRVGVALAGSIARLPSPLTVLSREDSLVQLKKLVDEHSVSLIVVGLPRNLSGMQTAQSTSVLRYAEQLRTATGKPVVMQDETLSSVRADKIMGTDGKRQPNDAYAAAVILHDYLEGNYKK